MDEDDSNYYNEQIKLFEQNSEDTNTLLNQQLSVVRSSLGAVNSTLTDVEYNENLLKEGINRITKYMNNLKAESNEKMSLFVAKIEVERHILRVSNAMQTLQLNLDLLIDSVVHAQKGALQPQIISPATLMETLIKIISAFPKDTALPIPMCKDSAHLLARLYELQVYTKNGVIGFVILLPLVNRCNFNVYRLIPIPVPLDRTKFLYVDTSKTFLWIDKGDSTTS